MRAMALALSGTPLGLGFAGNRPAGSVAGLRLGPMEETQGCAPRGAVAPAPRKARTLMQRFIYPGLMPVVLLLTLPQALLAACGPPCPCPPVIPSVPAACETTCVPLPCCICDPPPQVRVWGSVEYLLW